MSYTAADLKADLDQLAKIEDLLQTAFGDGTGSTSVSARAKAIQTNILDAEDADSSLKMLSGAHQFYQACLDDPEDTAVGVLATSGIMGTYYWNALRTYFGDLVTGMVDLDVRMHPLAAANYLKSNQVWPDASLVFPYATLMGTVTRGASTWTFTDGLAIVSTLYAPSQLTLTPVSAIGAADVTVVLTVIPTTGADATTVTVVIPAGTTAAVSVGAGRYIDVTAVACTGGTSGDSFTIDSVLERALPA
jgi:hypothetical protein